jgi:peptidylprolyl isomerase
MLKNGDFVRIEYDGYDDKGNLFDSTKGEIGKSMHGKDGPMLVVVGHYKLIQGLDELVRGMSKGDEKEAKFGPDKAFGHKNKQFVKVMSLMDFRNSDFYPQPGLQIHLDTDQGRMLGTIKSVSGGRVMVDFNHPLADKNVRYKVKITDVLEKEADKVKALMDEMKFEGEISVNGEEVDITLTNKSEDHELKKAMLDAMVRGFVPTIKKVSVKDSQKEAKKE